MSARRTGPRGSPERPGDRLVLLARSLGYGGAERQLSVLARGLHARGRDVGVVVFYAGGPIAAELRDAGVRVREIGKGGRWDLLGFAHRLRHVLAEERPAILHGYLDIPNLVALGWGRANPEVRVVWGVRASNIAAGRYDWLSRAGFTLSARLAASADLIIANSRAGRAHHAAAGFPSERMIVIPNGIDTDRFRDDPERGAVFRRELGIERGRPLVGLVGRLDPMKDHETFLRAATLVLDSVPDAAFLCVGSGDPGYGEALRARAGSLGIASAVHWVSARPDAESVYAALDVLCSSSAYGEGFSNVIGEAMASGIPCAVTAVGDSAWIVGDTGEVVAPGDPGAMAAALVRLLRLEERVERGRAARARVVEAFSTERLLTSTEEALWPKG